ncbi:uncharacterized protein N7515_008585 [Penicillium bovifimosum]|uniref:Zn(2)-C6 fungal-type domain-containing protein n=1 Tax=Penicillium bovifimosum TaxID=126998 RepID=A0A9W9GN84_9EURO|nr:uncharacterized protein N7515_008585 [Penicillium bovifimosum]KAJ5124760.1 hypothetical protein N7515_008585 [Penicillium bovifimosum]
MPKQPPTSPDHIKSPTPPPITAVPPFRSVSACNRCRLRKHRCDQRLPRCEACSKAQVRCVGYDPLTKQEVPRSYLAFLETRVGYLEQLLMDHGIGFKAAAAYDEAETRRIEAGMGMRDEVVRSGRKRKLVQTDDFDPDVDLDDVPTKQAKRIAQVNVLLAEIVNEGCLHRGCEGVSGRGRTRRKGGGSFEGRGIPWSPRSLDSVGRSGRLESPGSLDSLSSELDRVVQERHGNEMSLLVAGSTLGREDRGLGRNERVGLVDFEIEMPHKPLGGSHTSEKEDSSEAESEAKFDIAADLLRGRRERRDQRRGRYDLLDEFLVGWAD